MSRLVFSLKAELEYIARGPVVDVRQLMAKNGIRGAAALASYLREGYNFYLENFVSALELGANIVATPESDGFKELIDSSSPVFAWRAWGTRSRRLNQAEAWYDRQSTAPVALTERVNGYGISDAVGNVWTWAADRYSANAYEILPQENPYNEPQSALETIVLRGGSWNDKVSRLMRAAYRNYYNAVGSYDDIGLRVGARPQGSH